MSAAEFIQCTVPKVIRIDRRDRMKKQVAIFNRFTLSVFEIIKFYDTDCRSDIIC